MSSKTANVKRADQFPAPGHNHAACARDALAAADRLCEANNARFTEMRRNVLGAIWQSHKPISAYDLLAQLNAKGSKHAPVAVYRALDFLLSQGLVHRISSLNAFVGCSHPETDHDARFLICRTCHCVAELDGTALDNVFDEAVKKTGFHIERKIVEITGLCRFCADTPQKRKSPTTASKLS